MYNKLNNIPKNIECLDLNFDNIYGPLIVVPGINAWGLYVCIGTHNTGFVPKLGQIFLILMICVLCYNIISVLSTCHRLAGMYHERQRPQRDHNLRTYES